MADPRREGTGDRRSDGGEHKPEPIPRDMPDQQFHGRKDRWDLPHDQREDSRRDDEEPPDEELPDTDESGTGKRGAPRSGGVHPDHPVPDEPSA